MLHTLDAGEMVGADTTPTFSVSGTDGQLLLVTVAITEPPVKLAGHVTWILFPALTTGAVPGRTFHVIGPVPVAE